MTVLNKYFYWHKNSLLFEKKWQDATGTLIALLSLLQQKKLSNLKKKIEETFQLINESVSTISFKKIIVYHQKN
jgi:hypothetical protein